MISQSDSQLTTLSTSETGLAKVDSGDVEKAGEEQVIGDPDLWILFLPLLRCLLIFLDWELLKSQVLSSW